MAVIHIDHTPHTTRVCQALNLIVPDPGAMNGIPVRERKVLYLLHGLSDDASAWPRYTAIETLAACQGLGIRVEYHEEDARHEWLFWDAQIRKFLAFALG